MAKKNAFDSLKKVSSKPFSKEEINLALMASNQNPVRKPKTKKEIMNLLVNLGKSLQNGGTVADFCAKNEINPRQMREYRASFRANPNKYLE